MCRRRQPLHFASVSIPSSFAMAVLSEHSAPSAPAQKSPTQASRAAPCLQREKVEGGHTARESGPYRDCPGHGQRAALRKSCE
jgi:hypothetical protein